MCQACHDDFENVVRALSARHGLSTGRVEQVIREWAIAMTIAHATTTGAAASIAEETLTRYVQTLGAALDLSIIWAVLNDESPPPLEAWPPVTKAIH